MKFPELETTRLYLTEIQASDTQRLFEIFSNEAVVKYYDIDKFKGPSQATKLMKFFDSRYTQQTGIRWAIRIKVTDELIGTCGFNSWNSAMKNASIGYELSPEFWQKGYAFEAVNSIIDAAFSGKLPCGPIHRIQADTVLGNAASEILLKKIGFHEEGVRRQSGYWKGAFHDLKCFGLLAPEYVNE